MPSAPEATRPARTPPQLAKEWGCDSKKVIKLIETGQLRAFNTAVDPKGKPRWRIPDDAVVAFEQARAAVPAPAPAPAKRRKRREEAIPNYLD